MKEITSAAAIVITMPTVALIEPCETAARVWPLTTEVMTAYPVRVASCSMAIKLTMYRLLKVSNNDQR